MIEAQTDRLKKFRVALRSYGPFEEAIRQQWDAFEAEAHSGLTLDVQSLEIKELEHNLVETNALREGEWDIAFVNTDWIPTFYEKGTLADLAPRLAENPPAGWPDGWSPSLLRLQSVGEKVFGLPYHTGPECLIYRRDLFEDSDNRKRFQEVNGRELLPPRTWPEFCEVALFFNCPGQSLYGTAFAAFPDRHNSVYDFLLQLWTRGGELIRVDGKVNFQTAEAEQALEFYREIMANRDAVHPECREMDSVRSGKAFAAGEVAMMVNWFGFATMAHADMSSRVRGKVMVSGIPSGGSGHSISLNVYWLLSMAIGSPHAEIGWNFLRHVVTPAMDLKTSLCGAIGCRRSTWNNESINQSVPFYRTMEELQRQAREMPRTKDWPIVTDIIDELVMSTLNTAAPIPELLQAAQEKISGQLPGAVVKLV